MNATQAKQLTIAALLVAGAMTTLGELAAQPAHADRNARLVRLGVGITVLGVILSVMAEFAPQLAGSFAMLLLFTSLFIYGGPAYAGLRRGVAK